MTNLHEFAPDLKIYQSIKMPQYKIYRSAIICAIIIDVIIVAMVGKLQTLPLSNDTLEGIFLISIMMVGASTIAGVFAFVTFALADNNTVLSYCTQNNQPIQKEITAKDIGIHRHKDVEQLQVIDYHIITKDGVLTKTRYIYATQNVDIFKNNDRMSDQCMIEINGEIYQPNEKDQIDNAVLVTSGTIKITKQ